MSTFEEEQEQVVYENKLRSEIEVKQMLRDAIDKDPEGTVWHVNTKHLMTFAQMVADKTKREMASQAWEAHLYEQGEVESKEDQKKADEAAWSDARIACAAIRDAALDAAGEDSRSIATIYFNYAASCVAVDDHWDAIRAKREGRGQELEVRECKKHPNAPHGFLRNASHNEGRYVCECEHWKENT
jgi:hypothetical protein